MKKLLLILLIIVPFQAHAVLITTSIGDYEITTVEGTFTALSSTLLAQPWAESFSLAFEFAGLVQDSFGVVNVGDRGPYFGHTMGITNFQAATWCTSTTSAVSCVPPVVQNVSTNFATSRVWAVAEPVSVPEPSTLGLLGAGLLVLFMRRKRVA